MVFAAVILQVKPMTRGTDAIRWLLDYRMDLWAKGHYASLVDDAEGEALRRLGGNRWEPDEESIARAYNAKVKSGRLRSAVRNATQRGGGGILKPTD